MCGNCAVFADGTGILCGEMRMIAGGRSSIFPKRVALPREVAGARGGSGGVVRALPALVAAGARGSGVRAYEGRSRFVLTPLSLTLDQLLFLITAALLCFGLIMVQSADARIRGVHENWMAV